MWATFALRLGSAIVCAWLIKVSSQEIQTPDFCKLSCFRGPRLKLTEAMGSVGLVLLLPSRKEPLLASNFR